MNVLEEFDLRPHVVHFPKAAARETVVYWFDPVDPDHWYSPGGILPSPWFSALMTHVGRPPDIHSSRCRALRFPSALEAVADALAAWATLPEADRAACRLTLLARALSAL